MRHVTDHLLLAGQAGSKQHGVTGLAGVSVTRRCSTPDMLVACCVYGTGAGASHFLLQQVSAVLLAVVAALSVSGPAGSAGPAAAPRRPADMASLLRATDVQQHLHKSGQQTSCGFGSSRPAAAIWNCWISCLLHLKC
jgi:hypothetical protein